MTALALLALGVLAASASVTSDELAQAAREERGRRARLEARAALVTNESLAARAAGGQVTVMGPPSPAAAGAVPEGVTGPASGPDGAVDGPPGAEAARSEAEARAAWRERLDQAAERIARLEEDLVWARRQVGMLLTDRVVMSEPLRAQQRRVELDAALARRAGIERELAAARLEPGRIRDEARRAGVPPGWLR